MKYVQIKAIEMNSNSPDRLEDSVTFAVDETITKPEEVPAVLRKILKKGHPLFSLQSILKGTKKEMLFTKASLLNQ